MRKNYLFTSLALCGLLTACGGGSGSSSSPDVGKPLNAQYENKQSAEKKHDKAKISSPSLPQEDKKDSIEEKVTREKDEATGLTKPELLSSLPLVEDKEKTDKPKIADVKLEPIEDKSSPKDEPLAKSPEKWAGNFPYGKDAVPVYKLIENNHSGGDDEPNFKAQEKIEIALKDGFNEHPDYRFYVMDDNVYYGFYRDSQNMKEVRNNFEYSFKADDENKGDLSNLTANYKGQFWYTTRFIPTVATPSNVSLQYKEGIATGEITSRHTGDKLFDVRSIEPRTLELTPATDYPDNFAEPLSTGKNSSDRTEINLNFINGSDGLENKHIVGKGGNEKYWGVLGATQQ